jgi:hypothetical protein
MSVAVPLLNLLGLVWGSKEEEEEEEEARAKRSREAILIDALTSRFQGCSWARQLLLEQLQYTMIARFGRWIWRGRWM